MSQLSDAEILLIAETDKRKAFELAFNQFWEPLYRKARRKVQDENAAKDLVQDVFIVLWGSFDKLKGNEMLLPYLYAVLRNKILKLFEKDEVRLRYAVKVSSAEENLEPSSHQLLLNKELRAVISKEIDKMPTRMKEIYILKKDKDFSIKEIAQKLSLSEQTVKNQLLSAYRRLKEGLKHYGSSLCISFMLYLLLR